MTTINVNPGDNPQAKADQLMPGDILLFRPGTHYGRISVRVDSVVIAGETDAVLDGTEPITDAWSLATDSDVVTSLAATGTWRVPLSVQPWVVMDSPSSMIFRIDSDFVGVKETLGYYYMTAYGALAVPDNARPGPDYGADWWKGIEAMWVYNLGNQHLYVRYRDGRKPGVLRWSGGHSDHREPPTPGGSVIWLSGRRNIIIRDLTVRGCVDGIAIVDSANIAVERCNFLAFDFAVQAYGNSSEIRVCDCTFDSRLVGTNAIPPISKISTENPYPDARLTAYHQYAMAKFWHDQSDSTHFTGFKIRGSETGNPRQIEFARNYACACAFAVDMFGGDGIDIHDNIVEHCWDMAFQRDPDGGRNVKIHDNEARESGYCMFRWHASEQDAGYNYIYNNCVSDCDQVSDLIFLARRANLAVRKHSGWLWKFLYWLWDLLCELFGKSVKSSPSALKIWFYHNSFSGGNSVWLMEGISSIPGFCAVNNVLSNGGLTSNAAGWPAEIGLFDYNIMSSSLGAYGSWYGPNNVTNMVPVWPSKEVATDFTLPDGHPAKASGIDVSKPFTINGRTFGPLPGFESGYFEGAAPDRGWIYREESGGDIVAATFTAAPDSVAPGADVEISWTGSSSARDWWALYKVGQESAAFDKYGWGYTSCSTTPTIVRPSGTCLFTMPTELGSYEFQLFANDGVQILATSNQVTVQEAEPIPPEPEPEHEEVIMAFVPVWIEKPENVTPIEPGEFQALLKKKSKKS